jgi:hypothetical protein
MGRMVIEEYVVPVRTESRLPAQELPDLI